MREFSETLTIPVGQSLSNGVFVGTKRLVGLHITQDSDAANIYFQELVSGLAGQPSEVWADILLTTGEFPPYTPTPLFIVAGGIVDNAAVHLPRDKAAYTGGTIRLQNRDILLNNPANITGSNFTARLILDPHT